MTGARRGTFARGAAAVVIGALLGYLLFTHVVAVLRVSGDSMLPTLVDGSFVLVLRPGVSILVRGSVAAVGDVLIFTAPGDGDKVVKRVVATGGSTVAMDDGVVLVDGVPSGAAPDLGRHAGRSSFPATPVPDGHLFMLGDNRLPLASRDSRDFGPVPTGAVLGRVVLPATR